MTLEQRIKAQLKPYCTKERAEHDRGYMSTKLELLGCNMPGVRKVAGCIFDDLDLPHKEMSKTMNNLWKSSNTFDVLHIPLIYFQNRKSENDLSDWKILKNWTTKIDNWAHSDYLSDSLSNLLEKYPNEIYPTMVKWNSSKNSWQRRLSLTSLLYYSRQRKRPLPASKIFPLIKNRFTDSDPFVQKAVGWQLRECHNLWPEKAQQFIEKHTTTLSPIAFSYATEKWSLKDKNQIKIIRAKR